LKEKRTTNFKRSTDEEQFYSVLILFYFLFFFDIFSPCSSPSFVTGLKERNKKEGSSNRFGHKRKDIYLENKGSKSIYIHVSKRAVGFE
jgi:hypothetical protein